MHRHLGQLIVSCLLAASAIAAPAAPNATTDVRDLPVVRDGSRFLLDGKPWKAVGPNVYWLGLDENVVPPAGQPFYAPTNASYPTKGRVTEIMAMVKALGGTAIRAHTLGVSTGNPLSVWPAARQTNDQAFEAIDWAVHQARAYGLRLLVPLTDNYDYYHGGKFNFLRWGGFSALSGNRDASNPLVAQFYTNATVVGLFHDYVRTLLTHVNRYTNVTYAADPTIFAYETGNELTGPVWGDMDVPADWLRDTARLIKQLGPQKLVVDGTYGVNHTHLAIPEVDAVSDHFYPVSVSKLQGDLALAAAANKSYIAGEYSWTGASTGASGDGSLVPFFKVLEANPAAAGDMFWSLFGHNVPNCNAYVNHSDGLALQYGNPANSAATTKRTQLIRQHCMAVSQNASIAADAALPAVPCPAPDTPATGKR